MQHILFLLLVPSAFAAEYNESLAIAYAKLSGAAYCDADALSSWTCGVKCFKGIRSVRVCEGTSTHAFVGLRGKQCFSSFEGTNGGASVFTDMAAIKVGFGDGMVHFGFLHEWWSLKPCLLSSLEEIGCGQHAGLQGTGHSLGGAVASLAMMDLKLSGWDTGELYTFGQPRVGNEAFADQFERLFAGNFFRVTHGEDPFIDLPVGPFYVHVEPEVFYKGDVDEGYVICYSPFNCKCSAQYFPNAEKVADPQAVAWHHEYMGVDTTQAGCVSSVQVKCTDDIPDSWCSYGIACNKDVRGPDVHCDYGPVYEGGYGKCQCNDGFCPVNGRCEPKSSVTMAMVAPAPRSSTVQTTRLLSMLTPLSFILGCCVMSICFYRALARPSSMVDLNQRLLQA